MSTDFETRLAELLNESVDAQLRRQSAAPPFSPAAVDERDELAARRRRRYTVLSVAATAVAIVVGALTVNSFSHAGGHQVPPATQLPTHPSNRVPSPSAYPSVHPSSTPGTHPATASTHPSTARPSSRTTTDDPTDQPLDSTSVHLGGASVALPQGWAAHRFPENGKFSTTNTGRSTWCLAPASTPTKVREDPDTCPVQFAALPTSTSLLLDPENQGGVDGDAEYCDMGRTLVSDEAYGDMSDFGGRQAFYYQRHVRCNGIGSVNFAQYEVAGNPGFLLYAQHATSAVRSTLQLIASHSQLPAQTSTLWRVDVGRVTSITRGGSHVHLELDRVYLTRKRSDPAVTLAGQQVRYRITKKQLHQGTVYGPIKVGTVVMIVTDGTTVTSVQGEFG